MKILVDQITPRTRNEEGVMVKTLIFLIVVLFVLALAYNPAKVQWERVERSAKVDAVASDTLAEVTRRLQEGVVNERSLSKKMSSDEIVTTVTPNSDGSYCVKSSWRDPEAGVRSSSKGVCLSN